MEYIVQEILSSIYDFLDGRKALIGIAVIADNLPNGISGITAVTYSTEEKQPLPWLTKLALLKLSYDGNSETCAEIERALEIRKADIEEYVASNDIEPFDQEAMDLIFFEITNVAYPCTVILCWYDEKNHEFRFLDNVPAEYNVHSIASGLVDHMANAQSDGVRNLYR